MSVLVDDLPLHPPEIVHQNVDPALPMWLKFNGHQRFTRTLNLHLSLRPGPRVPAIRTFRARMRPGPGAIGKD